jgi:hypothetical protein
MNDYFGFGLPIISLILRVAFDIKCGNGLVNLI